jgi:uncharacterized protein
VRVVLDTNIIVSALIWGGKPLRLLELAAEGTLTLCTSPALIAELADVLSRSHLAERLSAKQGSIEQALSDYAELALIFTPTSVPKGVLDDADDDHVIAAAVAAGADAIISGDSDLLGLGGHDGVAIWTATEVIGRIEVG